MADSSERRIVEAASRGSGRRLGMGGGRNRARVGDASERAGDDTEGEQCPSKLESKEAKGGAPRICEAVSITIGLVALQRDSHDTKCLPLTTELYLPG